MWVNVSYQGSNPSPTAPDRGIAIVATDASKGFIALWVHLFVAIE